ncbi:MarR family winged helix-turn-helix transcriptional regulator [Microvirga lupini]|uniref:MarR family winged helix-turn-helix transcriptional regulator n=1 Tax=Microvirga lupini TaxID=420324 RepID=UPI0016118306|nr:MarR family transcriptional regulator [Microvirga lupini]
MMSQCYCTSLRNAARRVTALYDEAIAPVGVNIAQFALLRSIARGEPVALTELAKRTDLDRSTVGRNIRVLEQMGLVAMSRGKDQREVSVSLLDRGRRTLDEGAPLWDAVQARIEARMGTAAAHALRAALHNL